MKILFTPSARKSFLSALEYIRREDPAAAKRFRVKSESILKRLIDFPQSGRIIPEFPDLPFREVIVPPYRFFYRLEGETIWIAAVWHGAQLPQTPENDT